MGNCFGRSSNTAGNNLNDEVASSASSVSALSSMSAGSGLSQMLDPDPEVAPAQPQPRHTQASDSDFDPEVGSAPPQPRYTQAPYSGDGLGFWLPLGKKGSIDEMECSSQIELESHYYIYSWLPRHGLSFRSTDTGIDIYLQGVRKEALRCGATLTIVCRDRTYSWSIAPSFPQEAEGDT